ncbi:hypothetical protein C8J57DRAFT_1216278 [Mycena rebaudengoi]|nr:hypothetical protein C8J57DRAFT_1216278 [Mycena rebaudengoi]
MAKAKEPDKRIRRDPQGPALAEIPADAAITLPIGNGGGKSPPLPPPEQNQTQIAEQRSAGVPRRVLTRELAAQTMIVNKRVPSQNARASATTNTSVNLPSVTAPSHRAKSSLAVPMGALLRRHLTPTTPWQGRQERNGVKLLSQPAASSFKDYLLVDALSLASASVSTRSSPSRAESASIFGGLASTPSHDSKILLRCYDTSTSVSKLPPCDHERRCRETSMMDSSEDEQAYISTMYSSKDEDARLRAAIKRDGRLKNEYLSHDDYRATGCDKRVRGVAQLRGTEREMVSHMRDTRATGWSAQSQSAMHNDMAQEGAALRQDDACHQQREMHCYRNDTRTSGRDAGAQWLADETETWLQAAMLQERYDDTTKGRYVRPLCAVEGAASGEQVAPRTQADTWSTSELRRRERRGSDDVIKAEDFRHDLGQYDTARAERASGDAAAQERATVRCSDTTRQRREALPHTEGLAQAEDSRTSAQERRGEPEETMARERVTVRMHLAAYQRREALQHNECRLRAEEYRIRCREPRRVPDEIVARERAAMGPADAARQGREVFRHEQQQQQHDCAFIACSEAIVLRDLAEEEDRQSRAISSRIRAEKQRISNEAARDEDVPRRIHFTDERTRQLTHSHTSLRDPLRAPAIPDKIIGGSMRESTIPDELVRDSTRLDARKTRSQHEISGEHCITEGARRVTQSRTSLRTSQAPMMLDNYVETPRVTHDFYERVDIQRSRIRDLVTQGFSKIPDQGIAWRDNIPYEWWKSNEIQPILAEERLKVYSRPAATTAATPAPHSIETSRRFIRKSSAAEYPELMVNKLSSEAASRVVQQSYKEKDLQENLLGYKHGNRKEEEEAPLERGPSASLLAANTGWREIYLRCPSNINAAAPALRSTMLGGAASKQPSQLQSSISYLEEFLKNSMAATHSNMADEKSSVAEDERVDAKAARDEATNGDIAAASERLLKKSLAAKDSNMVAEKSPLAENMLGVQAKNSREIVKEYSAGEYQRFPKQTSPMRLRVIRSSKMPKEPLAANLQYANTTGQDRLMKKSFATKSTDAEAQESSLSEDRGYGVDVKLSKPSAAAINPSSFPSSHSSSSTVAPTRQTRSQTPRSTFSAQVSSHASGSTLGVILKDVPSSQQSYSSSGSSRSYSAIAGTRNTGTPATSSTHHPLGLTAATVTMAVRELTPSDAVVPTAARAWCSGPDSRALPPAKVLAPRLSPHSCTVSFDRVSPASLYGSEIYVSDQCITQPSTLDEDPSSTIPETPVHRYHDTGASAIAPSPSMVIQTAAVIDAPVSAEVSAGTDIVGSGAQISRNTVPSTPCSTRRKFFLPRHYADIRRRRRLTIRTVLALSTAPYWVIPTHVSRSGKDPPRTRAGVVGASRRMHTLPEYIDSKQLLICC